MRDSIVFYDSWGRMICDLPNEQAATLIKMVFNYTFNDLVSESDDITVNAIFGMIKEKLDEDADKWEETRRARSEAGKRGNAVRWGNRKTSQGDNLPSQKIAKIAVSDSVSVSVSDKDIKRSRFTPPSLDDVSNYVKDKGYNVDPEAFIDFYTSKGWKIGKDTMKDWRAAVRTWARRDNKPKAQKDNKFNEFEQNTYDYDELERKLTAN